MQELSKLNSAFIPMLEFLVCYKSEFGLALQRMIESYNLLMLMQFESLQISESVNEVHYANKVKEADQKLIDINRLRDRLLFEHESMQEVLQSKDKEI